MVIMTRRLTFAAAHIEAARSGTADHPTAEVMNSENRMTGDSYTLDVAVRGEIDPITGILVNIKEIDRIVREKIVQDYDKKLINTQVEQCRERPVTLETLILIILIRLSDALPAGVYLDSL